MDEPQLEDYREVSDEEALEAEVTDAAQEQVATRPQWFEDRKVTVYGREFTIEPPTIGITLRIINVFGQIGIRGERAAMRALQSLARGAKNSPTPSSRAAIFGMLAVIGVEDLIALGSAVLQFEEDRAGRGWLRQAPDGEQIPLSPLIRAMFLNLSQSEDLRDALIDFFDGLRLTENMLTGLTDLL